MTELLTEEQEMTKFPLAFQPFREVGTGITWIPKDLSDEALQATLNMLNYRKKEKTGQRGDNQKIEGLVQEKMRREMRNNSEVQEAPKRSPMQNQELPKELFIRIEDADGNLFGETVALPKVFKSGSTGYACCDKLRLPRSRTRFQILINLVKINSKAQPE